MRARAAAALARRDAQLQARRTREWLAERDAAHAMAVLLEVPVDDLMRRHVGAGGWVPIFHLEDHDFAMEYMAGASSGGPTAAQRAAVAT